MYWWCFMGHLSWAFLKSELLIQFVFHMSYWRICEPAFFLNNIHITYIFLYEIYLVLDIINQSFLEINTSNKNRKSL